MGPDHVSYQSQFPASSVCLQVQLVYIGTNEQAAKYFINIKYTTATGEVSQDAISSISPIEVQILHLQAANTGSK